MNSKYASWIVTGSIGAMIGCTPADLLGDGMSDEAPTRTSPDGGPATPPDDSTDPAAAGGPLARVGATDLRVAGATLNADATTTMFLAWSSVAGATGYRIERAPAVGGKPGTFASLGTSGTAAQTFKDAAKLDAQVFYRIVTVLDKEEVASAPVAAYPIASSSYSLLNQTIPGSRTDNVTPFKYAIEGKVRFPTPRSGKAYPLIVMMHGNHSVCRSAASGDYCPNMPTTGNVTNLCPDGGTTIRSVDGYDYLLDTLAAQGYVTVSIDANGMNCRPDFIGQRAQLILEHLRRWKTFTTSGGPAPLGKAVIGAVDMTRVGVMGHSRGAEAVSLIPEEIARTPIAGVDVKSVFAIAPTVNYVARPSGAAYAVLLPLCDGDAWDNGGIQNYDRIRSDTTRENPALQILFAGANHNYFNDVWTADDNSANGPTRTCASSALVAGGVATSGKVAQRGMVSIAATDWYAATLREDVTPLPAYLRGEGGAPGALDAWAGRKVDLRTSYSGKKHKLIDDFTSVASKNALGLETTATQYAHSGACAGTSCDTGLGVCTATTCNGFVGTCTGIGCGKSANDYHYQLWHRYTDVSAFALSWKANGARTTVNLGDLDASSYGALSFRLAAADSPLNSVGTPQDLTIRVTDLAGAVVALKLSDVQTIPRLYVTRAQGDVVSDVRPAKEVLQTVRITTARLLGINAALKIRHLKSLELAMDLADHAKGAVFVSDVELSE
jgi:hypothetical protein